MEKTDEENQKFINYWEYLGIPMNSPLSVIKLSFWQKFLEIEKSLDKKDLTLYTPEDLRIAIRAFKTLSNPYLKYLHNCEIEGAPTPTMEELIEYLENAEPEEAEDLDEQVEEQFNEWLNSTIIEYYESACHANPKRTTSSWNVLAHIFKGIAIMLQSIQTDLEEDNQQKRNLNL